MPNPTATPRRRDTEVTPHTRDSRTDRRQVATATPRLNSARALHSIYSQKKPVAVGAGKGAPAGGSVEASSAISVPPRVQAKVPPSAQAKVPPSAQAKVPPGVQAKVPPSARAKVPPGVQANVPPSVQAKVPPRVWNANKPKIVTNYNVYAKQTPPSSIRPKAAKTVKEWVGPLHVDEQPKANKDRSEKPSNSEASYVSLDEDVCSKDQATDQANDQTKDLARNQAKDLVKDQATDQAKDQACAYIQIKKNRIKRMAKLIAEVKEIRQKELSNGDVPPEEKHKPPQLIRSRTQTSFVVSDCHPTLYEYARRLPFVGDPAT